MLSEEIDDAVFDEVRRFGPLGVSPTAIASALKARGVTLDQVRRGLKRLTAKRVIEKIELDGDDFGRTTRRKTVLWRAVK